jgi:hypothetical protein
VICHEKLIESLKNGKGHLMVRNNISVLRGSETIPKKTWHSQIPFFADSKNSSKIKSIANKRICKIFLNQFFMGLVVKNKLKFLCSLEATKRHFNQV